MTLVAVFAAGARVAPIRFAMRVLAAMETGKGTWYVMPMTVPRMDCAAR